MDGNDVKNALNGVVDGLFGGLNRGVKSAVNVGFEVVGGTINALGCVANLGVQAGTEIAKEATKLYANAATSVAQATQQPKAQATQPQVAATQPTGVAPAK